MAYAKSLSKKSLYRLKEWSKQTNKKGGINGQALLQLFSRYEAKSN